MDSPPENMPDRPGRESVFRQRSEDVNGRKMCRARKKLSEVTPGMLQLVKEKHAGMSAGRSFDGQRFLA